MTDPEEQVEIPSPSRVPTPGDPSVLIFSS